MELNSHEDTNQTTDATSGAPGAFRVTSLRAAPLTPAAEGRPVEARPGSYTVRVPPHVGPGEQFQPTIQGQTMMVTSQ